jgi:hypothetical protein
MKKIFLPAFLICSLFTKAQQKNIFAFGSLDLHNLWKYIQALSAVSGDIPLTISNTGQTKSLIDAFSGRAVANSENSGLVAAAGYASGSKKLFFVPMLSQELRWTSLENKETPVIYSIHSEVLSKLNFSKPEEQISRMTIDKNGVGYALTNDAMHLIEFTTAERPQIRDLGQLVDAASNGQQSIHSACASFGGDMVTGDDGNIYLITMRNQIYSFHPEKRVAELLGTITGLPQSFTSNGAAANAKGELLVSCSNGNHDCYIVDPHTWEAKPMSTADQKGFNMSDLASGYLLARTARSVESNNELNTVTGGLQLYPNPLRGSRLQITMGNTISGNHDVQLLDLSGKIVNRQLVNLNAGVQSFSLEFPSQLAKGTYLLKLTDPAQKTIQTTKLIIQ